MQRVVTVFPVLLTPTLSLQEVNGALCWKRRNNRSPRPPLYAFPLIESPFLLNLLFFFKKDALVSGQLFGSPALPTPPGSRRAIAARIIVLVIHFWQWPLTGGTAPVRHHHQSPEAAPHMHRECDGCWGTSLPLVWSSAYGLNGSHQPWASPGSCRLASPDHDWVPIWIRALCSVSRDYCRYCGC